MDITPQLAKGRQRISGYGGGGFVVNETRHEGSLLVLPDRAMAWEVAAGEQISLDSLGEVMKAAHEVEILLIGTGARMVKIPAALRQELKRAGINAEVMDTGAACRTYNILLSEERRVAAALVAV